MTLPPDLGFTKLISCEVRDLLSLARLFSDRHAREKDPCRNLSAVGWLKSDKGSKALRAVMMSFV